MQGEPNLEGISYKGMIGEKNRYLVQNTIGEEGSCKVKLGLDTKNYLKRVRIKFITNDKWMETYGDELKMNAMLPEHPHIVKLLEFGKQKYQKLNGKSKIVNYIVFEHIGGGQLFDFVVNSSVFTETVYRYYYKILMDGLQFCHMNGVSHKDIKPENLLLNDKYDNFSLKSANFGLSSSIEGRDGSWHL